MRISDWSSDVCSSDLATWSRVAITILPLPACRAPTSGSQESWSPCSVTADRGVGSSCVARTDARRSSNRSEEHTSELQSLMRNSYAVFCLKKKKLLTKKTTSPPGSMQGTNASQQHQHRRNT